MRTREWDRLAKRAEASLNPMRLTSGGAFKVTIGLPADSFSKRWDAVLVRASREDLEPMIPVSRMLLTMAVEGNALALKVIKDELRREIQQRGKTQ